MKVFQPQPAPHRRQTPLLRAVCSGPRPAKLCGQPSSGLAICFAPDVLLVPWALRFRVRGTRIVLAALLALMCRFGPSLPGRPGHPSGEEKERAARGITLLTRVRQPGRGPQIDPSDSFALGGRHMVVHATAPEVSQVRDPPQARTKTISPVGPRRFARAGRSAATDSNTPETRATFKTLLDQRNTRSCP